MFKKLTFNFQTLIRVMKKLFVISIIILCIVFSSSGQAEKPIKAEIRHVTVFPDRAQVEHEAAATVTAGKSVLKLSGLSPYIDVQSIQVKGFGDFTILFPKLEWYGGRRYII